MHAYNVGQKVIAKMVIGEMDEDGERTVYAEPGDVGTVVYVEASSETPHGFDSAQGFPTVEFESGVTICIPEEIEAHYLN